MVLFKKSLLGGMVRGVKRSWSASVPGRPKRAEWMLVVPVVVLGILGGLADAAVIDTTWNSGISGNWNLAGNWFPAEVPNNNITDTFNVIIDNDVTNDVTVFLNQLATIDNLRVDAGDTVSFNNGFDLTIAGGLITNAGIIALNSAGSGTDLRIGGADVLLTGGGVLMLSNHVNNRIFGLANTNRLTNATDHIIQGAGQIGFNFMALTNHGLIDANQAIALVVDPSASGAINDATMQASSGGTLRLGAGTFDNTGGTIEALAGSVVEVSGATIAGGTLTTAGDGVVRITTNTTTLQDMTNAGSLEINNGVDPILVGTITNDATIAQNSTGATTDLRIGGADVLLTGGGVLTLSNQINNRILGQATTNRLTNAAGHTIQGAGQIGVNFMALTNHGLIDANQTTALFVDPSASGAINDATMQASSGGTLRLGAGTFDNTGGTIEALAGSVVEVSGTTIVGGTLTTAGDGVVRITTNTTTLQDMTNAGSLEINNGVDPILVGTITNDATIAQNSTGATTDLRIDGDVTLTGVGVLTLSNQINNRILGQATTNRLTNAAGHTIQGAGQIGVNFMALTNHGLIDTNQTTALIVDPSASGAINDATMQASSGGTLRLGAGTFDNTGGIVEALAGSVVELAGTTIVGGTLTTAGDGVVRITTNTTTLQDMTNTGSLEINNGVNPILVGTITNDATIAQNSTGGTTDLRIDGDVTLTGAGVLTLSNQTANRILGLANTNRLTNAAGHTIQGAGQIGVNLMGLTNQGTLVANQSTPLSIDVSVPTDFLNEGTLTVSGTGGMNIAAGLFSTRGDVEVMAATTLTRTGDYTQTAGTTRVDGLLDPTGLFDLQGGLLDGVGTVAADVVSAGQIAPGHSAGILTIDGNYTQNASGRFVVEIGGTTVGAEYDRLAITGDALLDGELLVSLTPGFVPSRTDVFTILTVTGGSSTVGGRFANAANTLDIPGAGRFEVLYTSTDVQLKNFVSVQTIPALSLSSLVALWVLFGVAGAVLVRRRGRSGSRCVEYVSDVTPE